MSFPLNMKCKAAGKRNDPFINNGFTLHCYNGRIFIRVHFNDFEISDVPFLSKAVKAS